MAAMLRRTCRRRRPFGLFQFPRLHHGDGSRGLHAARISWTALRGDRDRGLGRSDSVDAPRPALFHAMDQSHVPDGRPTREIDHVRLGRDLAMTRPNVIATRDALTN